MIRRYHQEDQEQLLDAWYAASKIAHSFFDDGFFEFERENIVTMYLPIAETWVDEVDGKVVGFLALIGNEVGGIFVHPKYQGKGIGLGLMNHAVNIRGRLVLNVFAENSLAIEFYKKFGFKKVGEVVHEASGKIQYRMVYL